ncbi:MAG TPA: OmpW family outer membrane protein [Thermoanaerobaculia bacterium]|nr:OmpW family outer membrane protein [Thermoanaerobaculia bacterium]
MTRIALILLLLATPLRGAEIEAGIRHVGMWPTASSDVNVVSSRGFAATGEVFWSEHVSAQFAATFLNPAAFVGPNDVVDLGTLGIDAYSASARWHFAPARRFSPFAGAGVALVMLGNLEDRFGDDLEITFDHETTFLAQAGVRYRLFENVVVDAAVSYMPLEAQATFVKNNNSIVFPETLNLNPLTVSVGAAYRF